MRVLVVSPVFGGSLPIAVHCDAAFSELGHDSQLLNLSCFQNRYKELKCSGGGPTASAAFYQDIACAVRDRIHEHQPNLVLSLILAPLSNDLIVEIRNSGICCAHWFVDDYRRFPMWKWQAAAYDLFFTIQRQPFLGLLQQAGAHHAEYLPNACPSDIAHRPHQKNSNGNAFSCDVAFMGTPYPNRIEAFSRLLDFDLGLWGQGWNKVQGPIGQKVRDGESLISPETEESIYRAAKVVLNLHTDLDDAGNAPGDFVNPRTFFTAACGTMQVVSARTLLPELYKPGDEVVTFSDSCQLPDLLRQYLNDDDGRELIAKNAKSRTTEQHLYTHRMARVIELAASRIGTA